MEENKILGILADNPALSDAVKQCIAKQFSVDNLVATDNDILLGQMVRARLVGLKALNDAFKEIEQHKTSPDVEPRENPAY